MTNTKGRVQQEADLQHVAAGYCLEQSVPKREAFTKSSSSFLYFFSNEVPVQPSGYIFVRPCVCVCFSLIFMDPSVRPTFLPDVGMGCEWRRFTTGRAWRRSVSERFEGGQHT